MQFQAFDYATLNNGISYNLWNYFIQDLIGQGLSGVSSGMSYDVVSDALYSLSGVSLDTCVTPCRCETIECECIEVQGSGGTYADETMCLSALTNNTGPCNCSSITGTSWNCFDEGPYEPTCGTKPYVGLFGTVHDVVDFYRTNLPNQNFIDNRFTNTTGIIGGTLNTFPILPLSWNQVWGNMGTTNYDWMDCYKEFTTSSSIYRPYTNIWWIAHPQLTGGGGVFNPSSGYWEYPNWNEFYGAAVAAGVPVNTSMSYSSTCQTLDTFFNPGGLNFQCMTKWEQCCSGNDCYCIQQWNTGGTYTTEALCTPDCCPTPQSGYTCSLGVCVVAPISSVPHFTTLNDCNNCITDPLCPEFTTCNPITWDCDSGRTYNSCSDSLGPINTVSPGSQGNQVGAPFITNPPTYPFTSDTLTQGILSPTTQVENIFTDHQYWDSSVPYSSATYEINSATYISGNITLPTDVCTGPNGYPVFRLMSIGHNNVNNGFEYNTWESFVSVASASPYSFNISVMTTASEVTGLSFGGPSSWNVTIEPCICSHDPCGCVPVIGLPLGQYTSSAMCEQFCCQTPVTYDCTLNGCVDPGNGLGAYTGYNAFNLCVHNCHEWRCNRLPAPDCECEWILGTGNTPTNDVYPGTPAGYYSCSTGCCTTTRVDVCPILFSVNDNPVTQDAGIYQYDITTNISQLLFVDPGYTFNDVAYWQSPSGLIAPIPDILVFTYKPNEIQEWYVSTNTTPALNRSIVLGQTIGRGLTNVSQFKLLSADMGVYEINLVNTTNTTANITTLFSLPTGYRCTGDISFDVSSNLMLILYDNDGSQGTPAPLYKLGKYDYNGNLLDEYTIPNNLLSGATDKFDSILCNVGPLGSKYVVSQSGILFEIIETPNLSIAPTSFNTVGVLDNTGSQNKVTGAEGVCGCDISIPETYDCIISPLSASGTICVDPGTGLGLYTNQTALLGGYLNALDECQVSCSADCTSWECVPGQQNPMTDCSPDYAPYPLVNGLASLVEWMILNGLTNDNFDAYSFESTNASLPSGCLGPNGLQTIKCVHAAFTVQSGLPTILQGQFYSWGSYIQALQSLGVSVNTSMTWSQVNTITQSSPNIHQSIGLGGTYCSCGSTPCYCQEIMGSAGYLTQQDCIDVCCVPPVVSNCMGIYAKPHCNFGPSFNGMLSDMIPSINCCVTIDGQVPNQNDIGKIIKNTNGSRYKITKITKCKPGMACDCGTVVNYNTVICPNQMITNQNDTSANCLSRPCSNGQIWDYNSCSCQNTRGKTTFIGGQAEISVMVSDFTKKTLGEVTTETENKIQLINMGITNCNSGTDSEGAGNNTNSGQILYDGCVSQRTGENSYVWETKSENPQSTYTCANGQCIELVGNSGGFKTLIECIQKCDTIGGDGSRPSYLPPIQKPSVGGEVCLPDTTAQQTNLDRPNEVFDESRRYVCQTTLNPLVGEYQKACVPFNEATNRSVDMDLYNSLVSCTQGCGGWFNCNVDQIVVDGLSPTPNQTSPVVMCCESYIMESTLPLTVQGCNTNCCDGTEIWFPLYNVFGLNKTFDSNLGYVNRRLTSLINSQICSVSETKTKYVNEGKQPISSGVDVNVCGGGDSNTISYVDDIPCYPTVIEALSDANTRGCTGFHTHMINGKQCYMACTSHSQSMGDGVSTREMMGGGPCICRQYQTGPDGLSKCIEWSPAGCGDNVMMTSNSPTRIDTPSTTPPGLSGRGMSSGGGY